MKSEELALDLFSYDAGPRLVFPSYALWHAHMVKRKLLYVCACFGKTKCFRLAGLSSSALYRVFNKLVSLKFPVY